MWRLGPVSAAGHADTGTSWEGPRMAAPSFTDCSTICILRRTSPLGQPCCGACPESPLHPLSRTRMAPRARAGPTGMAGAQRQPPGPRLQGTQTWGWAGHALLWPSHRGHCSLSTETES